MIYYPLFIPVKSKILSFVTPESPFPLSRLPPFLFNSARWEKRYGIFGESPDVTGAVTVSVECPINC